MSTIRRSCVKPRAFIAIQSCSFLPIRPPNVRCRANRRNPQLTLAIFTLSGQLYFPIRERERVHAHWPQWEHLRRKMAEEHPTSMLGARAPNQSHPESRPLSLFTVFALVLMFFSLMEMSPTEIAGSIHVGPEGVCSTRVSKNLLKRGPTEERHLCLGRIVCFCAACLRTAGS